MTIFYAGQRVPAASLNALVPAFAHKTSDEVVTNSSSLQDDNDLVLAVAANTTYALTGQLLWETSNAAQDIKLDFTAPSGATGGWNVFAPGIAATIASNNTIYLGWTAWGTGGLTFGAITTTLAVLTSGLLVVGSTAGSLQVRFAQGTAAGGTSTTMKADSWIRLDQVG